MIFQGDVWEADEDFKKIRNVLNDFFFENNPVKGIEINKVMEVVVSFSVLENKKILLRIFEVNTSGNVLDEEGKITIEELGPNT